MGNESASKTQSLVAGTSFSIVHIKQRFMQFTSFWLCYDALAALFYKMVGVKYIYYTVFPKFVTN
jgi:hypothetical protein